MNISETYLCFVLIETELSLDVKWHTHIIYIWGGYDE